MSPVGKYGRGPFTRDFDRWMNGALEVKLLSLREFCEENL
jgi:hypothetical protein